MNMDRSEIPLFIKLYEKKGDATDKLIEILRNTVYLYNVDSNVKLESITDDPENKVQNILIYSIAYDINNKHEGEAALGFLKHVFEKHYDNFPSYVEPI